MQKHERCALKIAQDEAEKHGMTVTICSSGSSVPKQRLTLHADGVEHHHFISSSPRDRDACIGQVKQWVRRTCKEIIRGRESL